MLAKANPNIEDYYKEVELKCRPYRHSFDKDNKTIFDLLRKYGAVLKTNKFLGGKMKKLVFFINNFNHFSGMWWIKSK